MNPYLLEGPAVISFSGGRTSGYMLHQIIQAHGGTLPSNVVVAFANTGKEREETLRFVHECSSRWGVPIHWLEWREWEKGAPFADRFSEVGYNSASRKGEPFEKLIASRGFLPNSQFRYCSLQLKIRTIEYFARSLGFPKGYKSVVGLRHDEGYRCLKAYARNAENKDYHKAYLPMDKAGATERDVLTFWLGPTMKVEAQERPQGFDLGLHSYMGNCDLCFLKRRPKLMQLIADDPTMADWWIKQETSSQAKSANARRFNSTESYAEMREAVRRQPMLPLFEDDGDEHDAECGLWCGVDDEEI